MAAGKKERARLRAYSMAARKSTNWGSVSPRTLTGPGACHSLKPAERGPMGAHGLQALSSLLGASMGLSAIIRVPYGSAKNRSRPNSEHHKLAQRGKDHKLERNSGLQLTAHGERHKLARKGRSEELAQHGKDHPTWHGKYHKLARESILYCNYRQSRINSLFFIPSKCNQFFIVITGKVQIINNNN